VKPVSELLLHEDVWVFVVSVFQPFEGEFVVVVVHVLVLPAWAAGENQTPPTAVNAARVVATVRFLSVCMAFTPTKKFTSHVKSALTRLACIGLIPRRAHYHITVKIKESIDKYHNPMRLNDCLLHDRLGFHLLAILEPAGFCCIE
jgi:hypothetical protein